MESVDHPGRELEHLAPVHLRNASSRRKRPVRRVARAADREEQVLAPAAVGAELEAEEPGRRLVVAGAARGRRPRPSPKSTQVERSVKSAMRMSVSAPITSTLRRKSALHQRAGLREPVDEPAAGGQQVEGRRVRRADPVLHDRGGRREQVLGGRARDDQDVDVGRGEPGVGEDVLGGEHRQVGGRLRRAAAMRRSRIPVRETIHSSVVSTIVSRSALVRRPLGHVRAHARPVAPAGTCRCESAIMAPPR